MALIYFAPVVVMKIFSPGFPQYVLVGEKTPGAP
jgi:hypothetical protein